LGETTRISWTEHTWNPWRGCTKVSPGCAHCYMYTAQHRIGGNPPRSSTWDPNIVQQTLSTWNDPIKWDKQAVIAKRRENVFTCSWSDFFHKEADLWRPRAWSTIHYCENLNFQILTKRPENIRERLPADWGSGYRNVWLGVSIENPRYLWRADTLRNIPARVHFISAEPLLASLKALDLDDIEWLIVGGESGPGYRPMKVEWARELRDKCQRAGVPYFFKQSAAPRTEMGTTLDGREWKEYPR
jgi:protein gp37